MARVLSIGHRGAAGHAPENTLAAVEKGIQLGVDFVEIDVRRTADKALVALHDATVNRTTDGKGRADALLLRELRAFDAGNGEPIPTVEEVLTTVAGRTGLMLELKVAGVADLAVQVVTKAQFHNPVIYASFLHEELQQVGRVDPAAALMVLFDRLPKMPVPYAMQYRPAYVGLRHDRASGRLVDAFHRENVLVWVYTPNSLADIRRAMSFGVDGIISNFPERVATVNLG
ncbi:MAG TPA: glycerophosphodiester phosphodiesterase family protein [Nitrospira sp.]|nr:glycerophosphodiester phosphodiesterase family protein [Nitrospira sp.]